MRYELMDYQRPAAVDVLNRLGRARRDWADGERSSFALSAITGSGKTVIATAAIEATFYGSADLGGDPDPQATFLWITDDPALNRQTRNRMLDASDLLAPKALVEINDGYLNTELQANRVYFLNIQKLSKASRLTQSGTNLRQASFWDVLTNTIAGAKATLYLILDEAHRGMKRTADRKTIVQRLIHGEPGSNPAVPVVWGISATIERFTPAMGETPDRTGYPHVSVDIEKVRASGLVKDEIGLEQPEEKGTFSTTLLRDAVRAVPERKEKADRSAPFFPCRSPLDPGRETRRTARDEARRWRHEDAAAEVGASAGRPDREARARRPAPDVVRSPEAARSRFDDSADVQFQAPRRKDR